MMKNSYAVQKKSNTRKTQSILDDEKYLFMRCWQNQMPRGQVFSWRWRAIALCTKKSNAGKGGKPVDEEQLCCVEEINCRAGKSLSMTIMINFALLTKSNARKAQSILDGEEQFCCAEEVANAGQAKSTLDDHLEEILWFRWYQMKGTVKSS